MLPRCVPLWRKFEPWQSHQIPSLFPLWRTWWSYGTDCWHTPVMNEAFCILLKDLLDFRCEVAISLESGEKAIILELLLGCALWIRLASDRTSCKAGRLCIRHVARYTSPISTPLWHKPVSGRGLWKQIVLPYGPNLLCLTLIAAG